MEVWWLSTTHLMEGKDWSGCGSDLAATLILKHKQKTQKIMTSIKDKILFPDVEPIFPIIQTSIREGRISLYTTLRINRGGAHFRIRFNESVLFGPPVNATVECANIYNRLIERVYIAIHYYEPNPHFDYPPDIDDRSEKERLGQQYPFLTIGKQIKHD
jgi:hypothetical protein